MANTLHFNSEIKPSIFKNVLTRYALRLIISALFIYIPLTIFILFIQYFSDSIVSLSVISNSQFLKTFISIFTGLITIVGAIFATYILFILPIFIVIEELPLIKSLKSSINYVISNLSKIILLSCIVINIKIIFILFSFLFLAVPVLGQSFFLVFFKGVSDTVVYSLFVVFYYKMKIEQQTIFNSKDNSSLNTHIN